MIASDAKQGWLGGSVMGALIGARDWSDTALGRLDCWPPSLRMALGICLNAVAPIGVCWGPELRVLYNDAWRAMLGDRHPHALGTPALELFREIWDVLGQPLDAAARRGEAASLRDQRLQLIRDGALRTCAFDFTLNPILDDSGDVQGVFIIASETTEQTQQRVLVAELQHRTRNLLAVVRAIASQTFGRRADGTALPAFIDRLTSLARVQGLPGCVEGERVKLVDIIRAEVEPFQKSHRSRIEMHGPDVRLSSHQVQAVALAVHELLTNAIKYGALQSPAGRLSVTWETWSAGHGGPRLALTWKESGVTMPADAAARRGQGRELIENALRFSLRAETQLVFGADGVWCRIELPLEIPISGTRDASRAIGGVSQGL